MNKLFYFRLAAQNLRKNGKFYIPYLLAGIGNVMMFYIMVYLRTNPAMENHESLGIVLGLGTVVIAIFSSVFFLMNWKLNFYFCQRVNGGKTFKAIGIQPYF